ncbi:MAG: GMC family oxidoreductase [Candidatus Eisenbacteria bacterium]
MGNLENVEVCVVGSGAGGSVVAHELVKAGIQVVLLERGRQFEVTRDYLATHDDFELRRSRIWSSTAGYPITSGPPQPLDARYLHLRPEHGSTVLPGRRFRERTSSYRGSQQLQAVFGVGGTTVAAAGQATRYGDETFKAAGADGLGTDWPIVYEELEDDYSAIERVLGVAGDPALPGPRRKSAYPHPAHRLCAASRLVARGCSKLGLKMFPQAVAAPTRPHLGRPACQACCSACLLGCPSGAKGSADVCFIKPALATGKLDLRTTARVLRIEPAKCGAAARVIYSDGSGGQHGLSARVVVMAAGAIETPRILLSSACGPWPHGAGNGSGQVGRNYQETLVAASWGVVDEPVRSFEGLAVDNVVLDYSRTPSHGRWARGFSISSSAASMSLLGPVAYALKIAPGWGQEHEAFMREFFGKAIVVQAAGEQLPSESNKVDLDPEAKDCAGEPKTRVVNKLGDNDLAMLDGMVASIREVLVASGAGNIHNDNSSYFSRVGAEPRGTCRMGQDPERSVVDKYGRSHEVKNLFVADGSVLVGGMHGNISLTIQALARRTARAIVKAMGSREI